MHAPLSRTGTSAHLKTAVSSPPALEVVHVVRRFGRTAALNDTSLAIAPGELVAVVGRSGSGKSTLLRVLAGLEAVDGGQVFEAGTLVSAPGFTTPAEKRKIGLVFQDFALFPHMTAGANVAFGLRNLPKAERLARSQAMLESVDLGHKTGSYPHQLSGGEQQRVALARALAPQPAAILLDEPFSGLDPGLRAEMQERTLVSLKASGTAALLVSHDTDEALAIANRIAVMEAGVISQVGTPWDVHAAPVSLSVAKALGPVWTVPGHGDGLMAETVLGRFATSLAGPVTLAGRPDATALKVGPDGRFTVMALRGIGQHVRVRLTDDAGHEVWAEVHRGEAPQPGTRTDVVVHHPLVFTGDMPASGV